MPSPRLMVSALLTISELLASPSAALLGIPKPALERVGGDGNGKR